MWTRETLMRDRVLRPAYFECGGSDAFVDGWTHVKTVPYAVLAQACQGSYEITMARRTVRVSYPEAFLTPPGQAMRIVHHCDGGRKMSARWIHFSFMLYETIDFLTLWDLPLRVPGEMGKKLGIVMEELLKPPAASGPDAVRQALRRHELSWTVLRWCCELAQPRRALLERIGQCERLLPVLTHLRQHLAQPLEVPALARLVRMSPSHFFVLFKQQLGLTPMTYLKRLRLHEAAYRITATAEPLKETAAKTGFANPFHLSREFKKYLGVSPTQYRLQSRWEG